MAKHYFSGCSCPFKGLQSISAPCRVNVITKFTTLSDAVSFYTDCTHKKWFLTGGLRPKKRIGLQNKAECK